MTTELDPSAEAALRERQHQVLADLDLLDVPADAELDAVVRVAAAVTRSSRAVVNLLDTERVCSIAPHGSEPLLVPRGDSLCHTASRFDGVYAAADLTRDPRLRDNPWVDGRLGSLRRYASAPLVVDGVTVGTLCVVDPEPAELTCDQLDRLADLALMVVALLERRRTARVAESARRELATARAFDQALLDALPVGVVASDADGRLTLFNRESRVWYGAAADAPSLDPDALAEHYAMFRPDGRTPLPVDELPLVQALDRQERVHVEMVVQPHREVARLVSCTGVPVLDPDGGLLGAVVTMADVTGQRRLEEQLRTAALHDGLTGLPNRTLLRDRLGHALAAARRDAATVAVLYCDLDGFKTVNDAHGHAVGDEVLVETAHRLGATLRPGDTVARIGGDEFVLLCPDVAGRDAAETIVARVSAAMAEPVITSAGVHRVGISVGVALSDPGSTPDSMSIAADAAMYRAKARRRQVLTPG